MRQRLRSWFEGMESHAIDQLFGVTSTLDSRVLGLLGATDDFDVKCDLCYGDVAEPAHRLDVYMPRRTGQLRPCILYIHGGSFRILSKDTHRRMALAFARWGAVVVTINYRLAPKHPYPAAIEDVCTAFLWLREHARQFGGRPDCIVAAGESAGGNLVAALAVACCYDRPEAWARAVRDQGTALRAVLPSCGLLQVSDPQRFRRASPALSGVASRRIRRITRDYLPRYANNHTLADPLCVLETTAPAQPLPPFLLQAGTADPIVGDTRRLEKVLARREVAHQAIYYASQPHAFQAQPWRRAAQQFWTDTYEFLDRLDLYRSG